MLLFDMDGTLIDSNGVWKNVDREFLARRGIAYTHAYYEGVAHTILPLAAFFYYCIWTLACIQPQTRIRAPACGGCHLLSPSVKTAAASQHQHHQSRCQNPCPVYCSHSPSFSSLMPSACS